MLNFIFIIKYSQVVLEKQNEKIQTKKATPKRHGSKKQLLKLKKTTLSKPAQSQ